MSGRSREISQTPLPLDYFQEGNLFTSFGLCLEGHFFLKGLESPFYSLYLHFGEAGAGYLQSNKHKFKNNI